MAHPVGLLTWTPGSAAVITDLWANGSDDALTQANFNNIHWNAFDSIELGGTEYQTCVFYNSAERTVLMQRYRTGGVFGAWRSFVFNGYARFSHGRATIDNHNVVSLGIDSDGIGHLSHDMHAVALSGDEDLEFIGLALKGTTPGSEFAGAWRVSK